MLKNLLDSVRNKRPVIHSITNYVTINDVANVLHASGAKPVMSDYIEDIREFTSGSDGLYVNLGMLNERKLESIKAALETANENNLASVLDPVGAGSTSFRTKSARDLISHYHFDAVRGNLSEIKALYENVSGRGVDADDSEDDILLTINNLKALSRQTGSVIVASGKQDIITDGNVVCTVNNGCEVMRRITGTGCMLTALLTAFIAANPENPFEAAVYAVIMMNVAGEKANYRMNESLSGNMTFRNKMIDSVFTLTHEDVERSADYEVFR